MYDAHGIIFAYASNARLKELIEHRTVASIPYGGRYRAIDFMLSNMVNAGIKSVGVIMRENYQSLLDHLGSGRDWDLARKLGGLKLLPPFGYAGRRNESAFYGKMEALAGVTAYLSRIPQTYVVLADGDLIANIPIEDVVEAHVQSGADITAVVTSREVSEAETATYVSFGWKNRVTDVILGRLESDGYEALGVYVMEKSLLDTLVTHCSSHNLYSFERDVLQAMCEKLNISAYVFDGYASRLQSIASYFKHNMDLLWPSVRSALFTRERPIKTKVRDEASTYYGPSAHVSNCVVADGCYIEGTVENSILFRGVRIDAGVRVQNSILLQDCRVSAGAVLNYAICDKEVLIHRGRMLMGHDSYPIAISKGSVV